MDGVHVALEHSRPIQETGVRHQVHDHISTDRYHATQGVKPTHQKIMAVKKAAFGGGRRGSTHEVSFSQYLLTGNVYGQIVFTDRLYLRTDCVLGKATFLDGQCSRTGNDGFSDRQ